jgi:N-methylhydantoinase B/oxoprolinase/acetone carboxylase alpha subunit
MESESEYIIKALEDERKKNLDLQEKIRQTEEETQKFVIVKQKAELLTDFSGMSKELSRKLNCLQKVILR